MDIPEALKSVEARMVVVDAREVSAAARDEIRFNRVVRASRWIRTCLVVSYAQRMSEKSSHFMQ